MAIESNPLLLELRRCAHFRRCGGCQHQHLPYLEQLQMKEEGVRRVFGRKTEPILASHPYWHYRNKMEFSFSQSKRGERFLGLMKKRGWVEDLHECHIGPQWAMAILTAVREWWQESGLQAYRPLANQGHLRTLTLREGVRTGEKMAVLTTSEERIEPTDLKNFVHALSGVDAIILRRQIIKKKTVTRFEEEVLHGAGYIHEILYDSSGRSLRFQIKAASFFQPNTYQAEKICQKAIELADLQGGELLLDLFCGGGALGIFAAPHVKAVFGIEIVPEAVDDARANIALNGTDNMTIAQGKVADILSSLPFKPSVVIVDPPRVGLGKDTIQHLRELNPEKIVYVSCNPISQATDCLALGYQLTTLQPIDPFPHTTHVENIALLKRE